VIDISNGLASRIKVRPLVVDGPPATVTVVISCFNYGRFLPQAVGSAREQEGVVVDVIIVDDASTDDSLAVARELEQRHHNVAVLAHEKNQGVVKTFNDGARRAEGEFVVRLDADDLLVPGSLSRATEVARAYPTVGLVYGHPLHFTDSPPAPRLKATGWTIWPGREWLADRCRTGKNVITSPEVVMRNSVLRDIGPQAPLAHTHDMEYWLRFAAFSDVAYVHGADQAWHREHSESLSAREVNGQVDLQERLEAFATLFGGRARSIPDAANLAATARSALVADAIRAARHELDRGVRESNFLSACLDFARANGQGRDVTSAVHQLEWRARRASPSSFSRGASGVRRFGGRMRRYVQTQNWHRNGVY
jgi:hypothetical protein